MCNPLMIAGAAMVVGSMVAKSQAAGQAAKARDEAVSAEMQRQSGYDKEAAALNANAQSQYSDFTPKQDAKAKSLTDYFSSQGKAVTNGSTAPEPALPSSGSNITVAEEKKQLGKAADFGSQQNAALGNLRSFGDLMGDNARTQAQDAALVGQIGGFKRGSDAVLPYELQAANQKGAGLKMFGDLLGAGGNAMLGGGMGGASAGWMSSLGGLGESLGFNSQQGLDAQYAANPSSTTPIPVQRSQLGPLY